MSDYAMPGDTLTDVIDPDAPTVAVTAYSAAQYSKPRAADVSPNSDNQPKADNPYNNAGVMHAHDTKLAKLCRNEPVELHSTVVMVEAYRDRYVSGQIVGYDLVLDDYQQAIHVKFDNPWANEIAAWIGALLANEHDKRVGKWLVTWLSGKTPTILAIVVLDMMHPKADRRTDERGIWNAKEDKMGIAQDNIAREGERARARARNAAEAKDAAPKPTDFDTFDKPTTSSNPCWSQADMINFCSSTDNLGKLKGFASNKVTAAFIHDIFHVESRNDIKVPVNEALRQFKARLDMLSEDDVRILNEHASFEQTVKNVLEATLDTPPATPEPAAPETRASDAPASVENVKSDPVVQQEKVCQMTYPESPVVVFPQNNGSVRYKGIKFSVTLRLGGTLSMAYPLMDEFVNDWKAGRIDLDPACFYQAPAPVAQPPESAATPSAAPAPVSNPVSDPAGNNVEHICQVVMHSQDTAQGKKITYDLIPSINGAPGKFKLLTLRAPEALVNAGVNVPALQPEVPFPVSLTCHWKQGKEWQPGKFYKDLVQLSAA